MKELIQIEESDWNNIKVIDVKMSIQTIQCNFISIENTISHLSNPEITEAIDELKEKINGHLMGFLKKIK